MTTDKRAIGRRITAARDRLKWTQAKLAAESGARPEQVSRWEAGKLRPSPENLERLAAALGVSSVHLEKGDARSDLPAPEAPRERLDRLEQMMEELLEYVRGPRAKKGR